MSRVKAIYRSWAIPCTGKQVYAPRHRAEWWGKIAEPGVRRRAEFYYQPLDALRLLRQEVRRDLLVEGKKHQAWKRRCQIPSIGPIRSAVLLGILQTHTGSAPSGSYGPTADSPPRGTAPHSRCRGTMRQSSALLMTRATSFWKSIPRGPFLLFLLGVFFLFITIGFASDIIEMGREPGLRLGLSIVISGIFPVGYAALGFALRKKFWKLLIPLLAVHFALLTWLGYKLPDPPQPGELDSAAIAVLHERLAFDGIAIMVSVGLGYTCLLYVTITQARRFFRIHAEIELATEIHKVLVPAIETTIGGYEFYGRSSPSGEVGGDLIDVIGSKDQWVAYLADVSGHGVAPGVVMGMVKSAARMLLSSGDEAGHLLPRLNEVLYPLKSPEMFVTFCFLASDGEGLRVGLAGHPAILHFSAKTNRVTQLECPNMPLGILPSGDFANSGIGVGQGDVFALYTDGFLEPANSAGEEFGIARLQEEFQKQGKERLEVICRSLQESVARHGAQFDDQSLLLIRKV
jgi:Stage II sporulation protein E (SpoIIE)